MRLPLSSLYLPSSHIPSSLVILYSLLLTSISADRDSSRQRSGGPSWGPWGEWSACSRTCGGGVYYQERSCLSVRNVLLKPDKCDGEDRVYQSCNIQDCPEGAKDFREEQCSSFNDVPYDGNLHTWVPYLGGPSQHCQLNCMPKGENFYFTQAEAVVDGTRCSPDTLNKCVAGICRTFGCDMMLNSTVVLDKCGECGGDNSSCKDISGEFSTEKLSAGEYNDIVTLPVGATSISVREKKYSGNYLALRNVHGEYYINGDHRVTYPQTFQVAGTTFHYERQGKPGSQGTIEVFQSRGPLTEAVSVMLLAQGANVGVTYEYSVPVGYEYDDPFLWSLGSFGQCSLECGGGIKHREVYCTRRVDSEAVADYYCSEVARPADNTSCNTDLCPPSWHVGDWSECPHSCGGEGVMKQRSIICMRSTGANDREEADVDECVRVAGPEPERFQNCNEDIPCPRWTTGEWSECSEPCGPGVQTRTISCGHINNAGILDCDEADKPVEEQICVQRPCSDLKWMVASDWTKCSGSCGEAMQSREIVCVDSAAEAYPEEACINVTKPEIMQPCQLEKKDKCRPKWVTTDWTECSASCGKGIRSRFTFCAASKKNRWVEVTSKRCKDPKPHTMEGCASIPCQRGSWMTGDWSQCSSKCGVGTEERSIMCFLNGNHGDEEYCKKSNKPDHVRQCINPVTCSADEIEAVSPEITDSPGDGTEDFCSVAMDTGPCREYEQNWYYDSNFGQCAQFWYGGCEGNDNRFLTQAACEASCIADTEKLTQEELCTLPKDVGPCRGNYPSYYYDISTRSCEEFVFGGCQGNQNRFSGLEECEIICGTVNKDPCTLHVDSGRCQESHQRWYYEVYSDACLPFVYSGCFGNPNRFASQGDCEEQCVQNLAPATVHVPEGGVNVCSLPVETGRRCRARILKWFYNRETSLCESFTYSGCDGNENNFETQDKCSQMCSSGAFIIYPDATTVRPTTVPEPSIQVTPPPTRRPSLQTDSGSKVVLYTSPFSSIRPRTKCQFEREDRSMRGVIGGFIPRCTEEGLYKRLQCHASTGYCFCVDEATGDIYEDSNTRFGEPDCEGLYYSEATTVKTLSAEPTTPKDFIRLDKPLSNVTTLRTGSRLSLRCHITGSPKVDYIWYKDRRYLSDGSDRVTIKQYDWGSRLMVEDVSRGDEGRYVCRGRNAAGDLSTNGIVAIKERKSASQQPVKQIEEYIRLDDLMSDETDIQEGARASFRCQMSGSPSVDYYWYKDGRSIDDHDSKFIVRGYDWGSRLTINQVAASDAGTYECRSRNAAGVVSTDAILTVLPTPVAMSAPEIVVNVADSTTLKAGATFKVLCEATGEPAPSVVWSKEGTPINDLRLDRVSDRAGKLKVHHLAYSDAGEYVCTADNGVGGRIHKTIILQVVPVNVGQSVVVTAHKQENVVLPCSSAGDYEVTVSWTQLNGEEIIGHDDRFTQRRDGSLRIASVELGDSQSYLCTGRIGQSIILTKNYQLNVQADVVIVHPPRDHQARVGETVRFTCDSTGSPIPETRWFLNNVQVTEDSRISFGSLGELRIDGVKSFDAGTYTCIVSNDISTARATAEFIVIDDSEIDPNCVDTVLSDCQLIVLADLCDTEYGPYCCRSCAGSRNTSPADLGDQR